MVSEVRTDGPVPLPAGLCRSDDGRIVAGVAGGVARYLGVDPLAVRLALVVLAVANGLGAVLYLAGWALLPAEGAAGRVAVAADDRPPPSTERTVGVGLLTLGLVLLFDRIGILLPTPIVWAVVLSAVGLALVWIHTEEADRGTGLVVRATAGGVLLVVGLGVLFASGGVLATVGGLGLAVLATGVGVALLLGPWIIRLWRELREERRQRIRSEERSDIAAHLHDSVLQTLALIQRAETPGRARALARRQERELRAWLFDERPPTDVGEPARLSGALEGVVTEVEERYEVAVDLVMVGDCPAEPRLDALVAAVREATLNASRHSGVGEVSVYVEVEPQRVTAYVRDRGRGFDPGSVDHGRVGIRESILARMARHGGRAEVHSAPGEGTEAVLEMSRTPEREQER